MRAYKFLRPGRVGPFSDHTWPAAGWIEADGALDACRAGVHACRPGELAYWLAEELWQVELDGEIVLCDLKVVAQRGRLVARVDGWDASARQEFADECVRRTAAYAVAELRSEGLDGAVERLAVAASIAELVECAGGALAEASEAGLDDGADLAAFVSDAAGYAGCGDFAGTAFVAAHAAVVHGSVSGADPFVRERAEQAIWLCRRLGLTPEPSPVTR